MKKILTTLFLVLLMTMAATAEDYIYSRQLEERAIMGDAVAMYELSVCYRMSKGVALDLDKSNYWLERAAQEGNHNAIAILELLVNNENGNTSPTSLTQAKRRELAEYERSERARLLKSYSPQELEFSVAGVTFVMLKVDGGSFSMGNPQGGDTDERPTHMVNLSTYYIGQTEVTQRLWEAVMGKNPSQIKGANHPVENVSWQDCQEFISRLNSKTGKNFRLPTEAEWEFAARGGTKSVNYVYSGANNLFSVAWFISNTDKTHSVVGKKSPNELGIYDMSGNVWEWCEDWYGDYSSLNQTDPKGSSSSKYRVFRGGAWDKKEDLCRVTNRDATKPDWRQNNLGLRIAIGLNEALRK